MQLLTAVMQPFLLDRATRALRSNNLNHYMIIKFQGMHKEPTTGEMNFAKDMAKLELPVADADAERIVKLIRDATTHKDVSDTIIFTTPMLIYDGGN